MEIFMKLIFTLVILILPRKITMVSKKCSRTNNCECFNNPDHYEFQCGNGQDLETILHVYPNSSIKIDCNDIRILNSSHLPNMTFEHIKKLQVRYCPLPVDGIREIIDHFGIKQIESLSFEFGIFPNKTLRKSDFDALFSHVKILRLRGNDLERIEEKFFENFPNLLSLELDQNRLILSDLEVPNLNFLSLSDNGLNHFPEKTKLEKLEKLNLWKNNLENFNISNLPNLKSLELGFNNLTWIDLENFPKLINVSLRSNSIQKLSRENLKNNNLIENFEIGGNSNLTLYENGFSNLPFLRKIGLSNTKLENLPENLFENSTNLSVISLERNELKEIPVKLFENLQNLNTLTLSFNQISKLNDDIFHSLIRLEKLDIQHNKLEEIPGNLFKFLTKLKEINLSYNNIGKIDSNAFGRLKNLIKLNLSHNRFSYRENGIFPVSPFNKCTDLEEIDLSHNQILDFPEDLMLLASMQSIDLSWNNISTLRVNSLWKVTSNELRINLEHNKIFRLNFDYVELTAMNQPDLDAYHNYGAATVVKISENPLICDCFAVDFVRYIRNLMYPGVRTAIFFLYDNLRCKSPGIFRDSNVENLRPEMLICPIGDILKNFTCTDNEICDCFWRPFDYSLIVDCARKNLTNFPKIYEPPTLSYNRTIVDLSVNNLGKFGNFLNEFGYENITELNMSNNNLSEVTWLPQQVQVLNLSHNKLSGIDYEILELLNSTSLSNISFDHNPWKCECSTANFTNFLRQHVHKLDTREIFCEGSGKRLMNLNRKDLCPHNSLLLISSTIIILILCIFTTMAAFYYKYQQEIKVWMYAHNICLFLIQEEELDKDKLYDAFISYSHKDEEFVIENLVTILENGNGNQPSYKLCLHFRNWIPGEFIATQITSSVQNSKRTLVVLSPNFLESVWGKMEFRTAHTEAMKEGRARVIIVLIGDIDIDSLDDELKAYMKTNTYIKWGDPWFWDKLKYALPHNPKIKNDNRNAKIDSIKIQKHANMMKYIDDKFTMISTIDKEKIPITDLDENNQNIKVNFEENILMTEEIK